MEHAIYVDIKRCTGCMACTVACMDQNDLNVERGDDSWRQVYKVEEGSYPEVNVSYVSLACVHCQDAPCAAACPTAAIGTKENGMVHINADLCIGSRFLAPGGAFRSSWLRRVGIVFFARLISWLSGVRVTDPTSGFRVYGRRAIEQFAACYPDDYPEPETVFRCTRAGLRVVEIPVEMAPRSGGQSSIRYLSTGYYMLKVTFAILVDRLRGTEQC